MDSSIVIRLLEGTDATRNRIRDRSLKFRGFVPCVSSLVRLECFPKAMKLGDDALIGDYRTFFNATEFLPVADATFEYAIELSVQYALKSMDSLHLATAELNGCEAYWTEDKDFRSIGKSEHVEIELTVFD